jgi:hypothetical protein
VMFGPSLAIKDGSRRKTYLIAILDEGMSRFPVK